MISFIWVCLEKKQKCAQNWLVLIELLFPQDTEITNDDSIVLTVAEMSITEHALSLYDVVTLSRQLAATIYAMHRCDVSHGHISNSTIQIGLTKNYKVKYNYI